MKMKMLKLIEGVFEWTKIRFKVEDEDEEHEDEDVHVVYEFLYFS